MRSCHFILPWFLLTFLRLSWAALIQTYACNDVEDSGFKFETFVIDVALDDDRQKLIFLLNSKVMEHPFFNNTNVLVSDVNTTTNRYTTFHVEIQFMGKTFINENKRFCDMVAVKNTSEYREGPRFHHPATPGALIGTTPASGHHTALPGGQNAGFKKRDHNRHRYHSYTHSLNSLLLQANLSIKSIFNNSTGTLVQCPLYQNDSIMLYYEADIKEHFHRLGSYAVRFSVVSNDEASTVLVCNRAYITPVQSEWISKTILIGIIVLLLTTAFINFFTIISSSYQETSNPFLFTASTICNRNLLRQLDATVQRIIIYLQFALFIGGLNIQYPGFYQPLIGQLRWCALLGIRLINVHRPRHRIKADNIYVTMNRGGLKTLAVYSTDQSMHDSWPNFMLCLICWIAISMTAQQIFLGVKALFDKYFLNHRQQPSQTEKTPDQDVDGQLDFKTYELSFSKNMYYMVGHVLSTFLSLFAFPFLVLTCYMLRIADNLNGRHIFYPNLNRMKSSAFSTDMDYDDLFVPFSYKPTSTSINASPTFLGSHLSMSVQSGSLMPVANATNSTEYATEYVQPFSGIPYTTVVLGSLLFLVWILLACFFVFKYLIGFRKYRFLMSKRASRLYTSMKTILLWGFSYHHYHPNRVYFVIFDYLSLLIKALIIGCLQKSGLVQVVVLIILELIDLVLLFTIQPYYLEMTWTTLRWILPVARFFVTALCIPYIRELEVGEAPRTYVAFAQLLIHAVVALVFIIQLAYCFISTIISIVKERKERKQYEQFSTIANNTSIDDFYKQFEFQPLKNNIEPIMKPQVNSKSLRRRMSYEDLMLQSNHDATHYITHDDDEMEDYYFRGTNRNLYKANEITTKPRVTSNSETINDSWYADALDTESFSSQTSFYRQQQRSNVRKRQNDYTFREADLIYKKYFVDASIDPEIKALWESRHWDMKSPDPDQNGPSKQVIYHQQSAGHPGWSEYAKGWFGVKPTEVGAQKGFQVSRPRPLIIKTMSEIKNNTNHGDDSDSGSLEEPLTGSNKFSSSSQSSSGMPSPKW